MYVKAPSFAPLASSAELRLSRIAFVLDIFLLRQLIMNHLPQKNIWKFNKVHELSRMSMIRGQGAQYILNIVHINISYGPLYDK